MDVINYTTSFHLNFKTIWHQQEYKANISRTWHMYFKLHFLFFLKHFYLFLYHEYFYTLPCKSVHTPSPFPTFFTYCNRMLKCFNLFSSNNYLHATLHNDKFKMCDNFANLLKKKKKITEIITLDNYSNQILWPSLQCFYTLTAKSKNLIMRSNEPPAELRNRYWEDYKMLFYSDDATL